MAGNKVLSQGMSDRLPGISVFQASFVGASRATVDDCWHRADPDCIRAIADIISLHVLLANSASLRQRLLGVPATPLWTVTPWSILQGQGLLSLAPTRLGRRDPRRGSDPQRSPLIAREWSSQMAGPLR